MKTAQQLSPIHPTVILTLENRRNGSIECLTCPRAAVSSHVVAFATRYCLAASEIGATVSNLEI